MTFYVPINNLHSYEPNCLHHRTKWSFVVPIIHWTYRECNCILSTVISLWNLFNSINMWQESPELPKAKFSGVQMHYLLLIRVTTFLYSTIHTKATQHEACHKDTTHISFQNYAYLNWQSSPHKHNSDMANSTVQCVCSTWCNTICHVCHTPAATLQSWQFVTIKTLAQKWCNKKCYSAPWTLPWISFRHQECGTERHYKDGGFVNYLYLSKQFTAHKDTSDQALVSIHTYVEETAVSNITWLP